MDTSEESELQPTQTQASKRRKVAERTVATVKIGENGGPPSDSWSWRKYGQKPIKGLPYPSLPGQKAIKCSTWKGCPAKKQVERLKADASMLIVTYTSGHNHPGPDLHTKQQKHYRPAVPPEEVKNEDGSEEEHF